MSGNVLNSFDPAGGETAVLGQLDNPLNLNGTVYVGAANLLTTQLLKSVFPPVRVISANTTLTAADNNTIIYSVHSTGTTLTLPNYDDLTPGQNFCFYVVNDGLGDITIAAQGGQTVSLSIGGSTLPATRSMMVVGIGQTNTFKGLVSAAA